MFTFSVRCFRVPPGVLVFDEGVEMVVAKCRYYRCTCLGRQKYYEQLDEDIRYPGRGSN
jgi:hypothetical protein